MDELDLRHRRDGDLETFQLTGVLDLPASVRLRTMLYELLDEGRNRLVLDVSGLRLLDCAAVGALTEVRRQAEAAGGWLSMPGATSLVLEVLEITGEAKKLRAYDRPDEPVTAPAGPPPNPWTTVNELIRQLHGMRHDDPYRSRLRDRIVEDCIPLADKLARRFTGLGEMPGDLAQVASLGLLKAVDGFDPEYGTDFGGYATPTIVGELKRHFRDKGWGVHVPRRLQELRLDVNRAKDDLTHVLGRSPTTADVAAHLQIEEETVIEALAASAAYRPSSLFLPVGDEQESSSTIADMLGEEDQELDLVDLRVSLRPLLARLPRREQRILSMRFFGNMTQADIAAELGISQMHVSRLLSRTLRRLRQAMLDPEAAEDAVRQ